MNKLDSELMTGELLRQGYKVASSEAEAGIILFNACSVRKHAEEKVYSRISALKSLKQAKPDLIIGLVGCMAQKDKAYAFKRVPFLDMVCGPNRYQRIPELIKDIATKRQSLVCADEEGLIKDGRYQRNPAIRPNRFQAYVRVMRGCNNFCSYCIVPYVRGKEISRSIDEIVDETRQLVDDGCKEITLLGQNVTSYGKSIIPSPHPSPSREGKGEGESKPNLALLLTALNNISGLARIRFVTSHPAFVTKGLLEAMRDLPKVCPYLHMPAQSGSDRILKAMNRGYKVKTYLDLVKQAREIVPDIEIASDFIVGFPGETEADFEATVDLMRQARFLSCFIFQYSTRPGTQAADLEDSIPAQTKKERNNLLLAVQAEVAKKKHQAMVGRTMEILVEGPSKLKPERQTGRVPNNYRVVFESDKDLKGQLVQLKITSASTLTLYGQLVR